MALSGIHTGDSHIDSDVHGSINPATGINRAWESNAEALKSAVDAAIERKADFFVHAGDAFKTGRPSQEALLLSADTFRPLVREGIPLILVDGNHERYGVPTNQRTATTTLGEILAQEVRGGKGEVHVVEREPKLIRLKNGLQAACLPWLSKTTILARLGEPGLDALFGDRLVVDFAVKALEQMCTDADDTAPLILASHVTMDDVRIDNLTHGHRRGSEVDIAHLFAEPILPRKVVEDLPFSYAALSHIHARQRIGTKCFYAGSTNRITMTDADDEKSVNFLTLGDDNTLDSVEFIPTAARPMHQIDLTDRDAEERLESLEAGSLVGLVLAPGDALPPDEVKAMVAAARATIVSTKTVPVDRPRTTVVTLPEKINPVTALSTWLDERQHEDLDRDYLLDKAAELVNEDGAK